MSKATVKAKLSPEGLYQVQIELAVDVGDELERLRKISDAIEKAILDLQYFIENCVLETPDPDPDPVIDPPVDPDSGDPPVDPDSGDPEAPDPDPDPPLEPDPEGPFGIGGNVKGEAL